VIPTTARLAPDVDAVAMETQDAASSELRHRCHDNDMTSSQCGFTAAKATTDHVGYAELHCLRAACSNHYFFTPGI